MRSDSTGAQRQGSPTQGHARGTAGSHQRRPSPPSTEPRLEEPTRPLALYRRCIEKGLLQRERIAQTTFFRLVREYDLLKPDADEQNKRLAFSKQYANELWQADTMFGPYVRDGAPDAKRSSSPSSTTPAACSATASSSSRRTPTP